MKSCKKGICGVILLLLFCGFRSSASETTVFVAGNSDLYPIEYYDSSSGQYLGLMPEIYDLLSEKTGYDFCYINAGAGNGQERMAKNCQAEIVSAHIQGDIDPKYLKEPQYISMIYTDGKEKSVQIAFTEIASEKLISDISKALAEITTEQKLLLVSSHTAETVTNGTYIVWIYILSGCMLLFFSVGVITLIRTLKRRRLDQKNNMIDSRYGIGNDQYYIHCFDHLISDKSKSLYYIAYIAFDEEEFNQQYGSLESKDIQRYVAEFLNTKTGAVEYLAIVSEGVFAFVYQSANKDEAEKRISSIMDEMETYLCQFKSEYAGLFHAGICILEENMGCSGEAAFYNAKQGYLYAAHNKMRFAFSTKSIVEETRQNERLHQRIMQAIKNEEFEIYIQFIVDRNGTLFGAEAVSRWQHPEEGLLSPGKYIKMMNQSDVGTAHDLYIFSQVCRQLEEWQSNGNGHLFLSCNFTRYSVTTHDFVERLKEVLNRYHFNHNKLIMEITEDALSYDTKALLENLKKCKELGFFIALDDIGSGYTTLSDLYHYPIDFVKVEREIVLNAMEERGKMLLNGLIHLAHSMNMKVLCEGVESDEQNKMVLSAGCDYIQGYYYFRVLPRREAAKYLNSEGR